MHFKIRTKLITAFLGIIFPFLLIVGIISIYNLSIIYKSIHRIEATTEQRARVTDLRFAIEGALMPGNDYIITGDKKYIDDFQKESKGVEERLKHLEEILAHPAGIYKANEKMEMLKDTKNAWQNIKGVSLRIFEIPDPVGNRDASRLMEEMDYKWGYPAIERLRQWREIDLEEYREAHEMSEKAWRQASIIMVAGSIILVALGVSFAMFYSKIFVRPIEAIHVGADAIAAGNFKTRLDIKTGDEIEQLAGAMNEMAEKLDDFYGILENQVEERTKELQESEEKYRTMIENANDMIWTLDTEGRFTFINRQAVENAGYAVQEVIGKHYFTFVHPEDKAMREEYFKRTLLGERTQFTVRSFGKDHGERILILQVSSAPAYKDGKVVGTVNFGRDITDLRKAEEKLKESEERFRIIAETAADAIICMRSPGAVTLWNRSAERMFGYAADDVIGKNLHDIIVPERYKEKSREGLKGFFETGTGPVVGKVIEIFALRRDGSEFPVELSISAMRIKDEWQTAAIVRDITERKQAEEKLKRNVDDLKRMNKMMVDREIRMIELKKENQKLINEIQDLKFKIP